MLFLNSQKRLSHGLGLKPVKMLSPIALTVDFSLLSDIFQSRSLLEMARISCRVSHSNTKHNSQMSCKINKFIFWEIIRRDA